jgi:hypothetical protein
MLSSTVTIAVHVEVLPHPSVAVNITSVVPILYTPLASLLAVILFVIVVFKQLSVAVGIASVTVAVHTLASADTVISVGHPNNAGGVSSSIVIV